MASRNAARKNEWSWEDFRPEWANERLDQISAELEKWNDDLQARGRKFRKQSQKRIDKSVAQVRAELDKLPAMKRARTLRKDLGKRVDAGVDGVYTRLKIARLEEVKKLERKIAQLNRKLKDIEQGKAA